MMKTTVWFVAVLFVCVWTETSSFWLASIFGNGGRPRPGWPSFSQLRSNYPRYGSIGFDGLVDQEGLPAWLKGLKDKNTCAMRVSRALTHAGRQIDVSGTCYSKWSKVKDSQGRPYIIRVATMRCYLENEYGDADVTGSSESSFRERQGIIVFEGCNFIGATGHVDLWDGSNCVGRCPNYFGSCNNIRLFEF
ncbi:hypothetical protein Bbelb_368360 [Branchiostoma belcheri]|nr:hypothetical protein Bbelb_368360 [Branchiostoma belcheri]